MFDLMFVDEDMKQLIFAYWMVLDSFWRQYYVYPDMPTGGLFRFIRQPIYVAFALTLWTVPIWTPDQFVIAVTYTLYCLLAPKLKERRFAARYGARFEAYRSSVPYALPRLSGTKRPGAPDGRAGHDPAAAGPPPSSKPSPAET